MVSPDYRGKVDNQYCGHCHHATIAMYNLLGGKSKGYRVRKAIDELQIQHYWLESPTGEILDPTVEQYTNLGRTVPYTDQVSRGISYRKSNSAKKIISNVLDC